MTFQRFSLLTGVCLLAASSVVAQNFNRKPIRVIGHARNIATAAAPLDVDTLSPNLVEGRELFNPLGIAVDTTSNPPALFVSDTGNHRVLGWRDANGFASGSQPDLIIGQKDRFTALPLGPGTAFTTGFSSQTGLLVDRNGSLYVADSGNNRVLRFPRPFSQPQGSITPDLVIGQPNFNTATVNQGGISAQSLASVNSSGVFRVGLALDPDGNLYVVDPVNHRVLRYPASSLNANRPAADLVLGQADFTARATSTNRQSRTTLNFPVAVAVDASNRVYVSDAIARVLVYAPPATGAPAARIMGLNVQVPGQPVPPPISPTSLNVTEDIVIVGGRPVVADTGNSRILVFDPFDQWPNETSLFSPAARFVIGQENLTSGARNRGQQDASAGGVNFPRAIAATEQGLFVADSGNHRVVAFPASGGGNYAASAARLLGQLEFTHSGLNLVEGRELFLASGLALDTSVVPARIFISDTGNNRILGFRDFYRYRLGDAADIVIGQPDRFSTRVNYPTNDAAQPNDSGLNLPQGIVVDAQGNLYVADNGNSRVLRFPKPFDQPAGQIQRADLVIGQQNFTSQLRDPNVRSLRAPIGLALTLEGLDPNAPGGALVVSDVAHHRVLVYPKPFANGMAASRVIGQPDFSSIGTGADSNRLNSPRGLAIDTQDRLYVADLGNGRVLIFDRVSTLSNQPVPAIALRTSDTPNGRLNQPNAVALSSRTGELWVADVQAQRVYRYPAFDQLLTTQQANFFLVAARPLAVHVDAFGSPLISDSFNRVGYYVPDVVLSNAANYFLRASAPGTIVSVFPGLNNVFGEDTQPQSFDSTPQPIPLPTTLADLQVLIRPLSSAEATPVGLFYSSKGQINVPLPLSLPDSGSVELQVVKASTGQIFGAADILMAPASPAFFTAGSTGTGQIAALNEDGTVNSASNPIDRGRVIALFGTGQGFVENPPADGELTQGPTPTRDRPRVIVNTAFVPDGDIQYSGLAPGLIGVWQLNVRIPDNTPPRNDIVVVVEQRSVTSNNDSASGRRIVNTIAVK